MTEREKLARGLLYDPNHDQELIQEMLACKELCFQLNQLPPFRTEERAALLTRILGGAEGRPNILSPFWCDYGRNIRVGRGFFANHNCVILDGAAVTFGDHVFIGPNCCFTTAGHPVDPERRSAGLEFARPIIVGSYVWFGANATVLPGVSIGDNAVIGAGSVVAKSIPANVVAAGSPCRVLRAVTEADRETVYES